MRGEKKRGSSSRRRDRISANANTLEMQKAQTFDVIDYAQKGIDVNVNKEKMFRNSEVVTTGQKPSMNTFKKLEPSSSLATPAIIINNVETGGLNREFFNNENERGQKISTANVSEKGSITGMSQKEEDIM